MEYVKIMRSDQPFMWLNVAVCDDRNMCSDQLFMVLIDAINDDCSMCGDQPLMLFIFSIPIIFIIHY